MAPQAWLWVSPKWAGVAAGAVRWAGGTAEWARVCEHMYTCISVLVGVCIALMNVYAYEYVSICVYVFMNARAYLCLCLGLTDSSM